MITFLKTAGILACMLMIIPLAVWGGSGSFRYALQATKSYLLVMAALVVPVLIVVLITSLPLLF